YKTYSELTNDNTWGVILGDPDPGNHANPILPNDAHMQEAIDSRPGLPGPNTPPNADPINGHERNIMRRDDLQYSCIFQRPTQTPCVDTTCDCFQSLAGENNPLCASPSGTYDQVQYNAKAYPALRELQLVHDVGRTGIG